MIERTVICEFVARDGTRCEEPAVDGGRFCCSAHRRNAEQQRYRERQRRLREIDEAARSDIASQQWEKSCRYAAQLERERLRALGVRREDEPRILRVTRYARVFRFVAQPIGDALVLADDLGNDRQPTHETLELLASDAQRFTGRRARSIA